MFTPIQKQMMLKLFSMFVVVRGFNLALIVIAQYITAVFIMAPPSQSLSEILFDRPLFALIFATVGAIASGYIINNFYDSEKDSINRPRKSTLEQYVSQNTKLVLYFIINFIVVFIASYVSFRSVLFFSIYIFANLVLFSQNQKNANYWKFDLSNFNDHPFFCNLFVL